MTEDYENRILGKGQEETNGIFFLKNWIYKLIFVMGF